MSDSLLRRDLIKLAAANPEIRPYVLPLLKKAKTDWLVVFLREAKRLGKVLGSVKHPHSNWNDSERSSFEFSVASADAVNSSGQRGYDEPRIHIQFRVGGYRDPVATLKMEGVGFRQGSDVKTWNEPGAQDLSDKQWKGALNYLRKKLTAP